jgi:hypothetical protein
VRRARGPHRGPHPGPHTGAVLRRRPSQPYRPVSRQRRQPDVLHASIILAAEIPAACAAACEVCGEPWQHRPSAICLRAMPRLHHRLTALGMPAAATDLETGIHHWTRTVKLALGLRTPTSPIGRTKPLITGSPPRGPGELGILEALADSPASIDALAAHRAAANGLRPASSSSTSSADMITDREVLPWRGSLRPPQLAGILSSPGSASAYLPAAAARIAHRGNCDADAPRNLPRSRCLFSCPSVAAFCGRGEGESPAAQECPVQLRLRCGDARSAAGNLYP